MRKISAISATRLFAIDRDGKNLVRLLGKTAIRAQLGLRPGRHPQLSAARSGHILMVVDGRTGAASSRSTCTTGVGEVIEHAAWRSSTGGWTSMAFRWCASSRAVACLRFYRHEARQTLEGLLQGAAARAQATGRLRSPGTLGPARQVLRAGAAPKARSAAASIYTTSSTRAFGAPIAREPRLRHHRWIHFARRQVRCSAIATWRTWNLRIGGSPAE